MLDPGLGKTSVSLAAYKILKKAGFVKWALIIAPLKPMYETWPAEIKKWSNFADFSHGVLHGPKKAGAAGLNPDLYLINPEGLEWLLDGPKAPIGRLFKRGPGMLVVDESTKFKDSSTKRFKLLRKVLPLFDRRYILTGTFKPNTAEDLFGQVYILDGGNALGKYITHFRSHYFYLPNPIYEKYKYELADGAFERIVEKVSPLVLQLNAEDYLKMPELITVPDKRALRYVTLPAKAREKYAQVEQDFITQVGENYIVAANAAVAGGKCRQMANGAIYMNPERDYAVVHNEKLDNLKALVEELQGDPLLVLYEFVHDKERILEAFPGTPYIGNGVSPKKVGAYVASFNAGALPMLLGHPASMGHGLNLQGACRHVCWFGIPWNFEYYDQAIRRVYRQGQKSKTVFIYHIVARGTLDEKVLGVLGQKHRSQKDLFKALQPPV